MKIRIMTLFPEIYELYLSQTILKRADVDYDIVNIRDYAKNVHTGVDDTPFGGGAGMLLKPEPFFKYFFELKDKGIKKPYTVFVSPQGKLLNQATINRLNEKEDLVLISGRYEGLDQRVIDQYVDEEISIGDFVLTSGDLPCLSIIDAMLRQKDGVIKKESYETDSFYNGLLGFPQYTKPQELGRHKVPDVLISGNHKLIEEYRFKESVKKTMLNRPNLLVEKMKDEKFYKRILKLL